MSGTTIRVLFFGSTGWIGGHLINYLKAEFDDIEIIYATARLEQYEHLREYLKEYTDVDYIVLAAGLTGRPNIDWCEDHKDEVVSANVMGPVIIGKFGFDNNIHVTYLGTGCIYTYKNDDQANDPDFPGFAEDDIMNFDKSWYSFTKIQTELLMKQYNALILRFRMPISDDLHHRSLVSKLIKYDKIVNVPNSMTVVSDLVPKIPVMMKRHLTGSYNFTNPGVLGHNDIMDRYKKYIDPDFSYTNFSLHEQDQVLKAARSNVKLDVSKLLKEFPDIPPIIDSIDNVFERIALNVQDEQ